jgi:hypothetical protein
MFHPTVQDDDVDDIALLAARRRNQSNKTSAPTITINNDFAGLAQILRPAAVPSTTSSHNAPGTPQIRSPAKPAHMTFSAFCLAADLPDIPAKLEALAIRGPHVLEFIENSKLDEYLVVGERADLRFAESQWKKGLIR